ncbi:MAG: VOC family protein [Pseudomonadota bacterium]
MRRKAIALLTAGAAALSGASCLAENEKEAGAGVKGVRYIGVTVSDIDDTLAFYNQGVAYDVIERKTVDVSSLPDQLLSAPRGKADVALVKLPNVYLRLIDFDPDAKEAPSIRPVIGPGYTHICYISPATNSAYDKFRAAGLDMVSRGDGPVDIGGYGMLYAYGRDPDGTMIEMEVASKPRRADDFWVGHIAVTTPDIERMLAFYSDVIGYGPRRRTAQENHPKIDAIADIDNAKIKGGWFALRNMELEVWTYERPETPSREEPAMLDGLGYNSIAFEVDDLDAEMIRLREEGLDFTGEPAEEAGWRVAYAYDPDGNLISFQENASGDPSLSIDPLLWIDPETF